MNLPLTNASRVGSRPAHLKRLRGSPAAVAVGLALVIGCCTPSGPDKGSGPATPHVEPGPGGIVVLLASASGVKTITLHLEGEGRARCGEDGFTEWPLPRGDHHFHVEDGSIFDALGKGGDSVKIRATTGLIGCHGRRYPGALVLSPDGAGGMRVTCHLSIEEYLRGVVGSEMPPSWPIEALKAQAVAARSYALARRSSARARASVWDVFDDTRSQVFTGEPEGPHAGTVARAVRETAGEVLVCDGRLLQAFFHSTCGGRTEPADRIFGTSSCGALAGVECGFCGDSPAFAWEAVIPSREVEEKAGISPLLSIEGVDPGQSGRFATVRIGKGAETLVMKTSELRRRLGYGIIRSTAFSVEIEKDQLVFRGKGFGHGVGLCQWGARGMAAAGHDYAEILTRYYPGAMLIQAAAISGD